MDYCSDTSSDLAHDPLSYQNTESMYCSVVQTIEKYFCTASLNMSLLILPVCNASSGKWSRRAMSMVHIGLINQNPLWKFCKAGVSMIELQNP